MRVGYATQASRFYVEELGQPTWSSGKISVDKNMLVILNFAILFMNSCAFTINKLVEPDFI